MKALILLILICSLLSCQKENECKNCYSLVVVFDETIPYGMNIRQTDYYSICGEDVPNKDSVIVRTPKNGK